MISRNQTKQNVMQHNINHPYMRLPGIIILFLCFTNIFAQNEAPRGKQRGIKIPTAQGKSRSKLRGTNPLRD